MTEMFIAVLSHDLRNPLNAVYSAAELLMRRSDDDVVRAMSTQIKTSGQRMRRMIDDLLDVARVRLGGGIVVQQTPTEMGEVVGRAVSELRAAHPERQLDIEQVGDLTGHWDADRLSQLASNLVGNALTHGASSAPITIHLDGSASGQVVMKVVNVGVIAKELLPHLFEPFRRGERVGKRNGLGLGLYIVKQIVERHRGTIEVGSSPETGSTVFTVSLPRQPPPPPRPSRPRR